MAISTTNSPKTGTSTTTSSIDDIINDPKLSAIQRESSSANTSAVVTNSHISIPIIDMTAPHENEMMEQMWNAARDVGFFTIINHGIATEDIDSVFRVSRDFFGRPLEEKRRYPFGIEGNSGYEYMTQAPPSTNTVDQKECMQITAREGCMDDLWPSSSSSGTSENNFRDTAERMTGQAHELARRILTLLEPRACPHLKPGTLANSHNIWNEDGQCMLRLIHYPPVAVDHQTAPLSPLANNAKEGTLWRAGAHTDWGCITLLFQRPGEDGLECRADPHGTNPHWIPVPPVENGITVNVGDMLRVWSDGRLLSNMHRVRMPRTREECGRSRYSVAFFLQADRSAVMDSGGEMKSMTAGEYFAGRINSHYSE